MHPNALNFFGMKELCAQSNIHKASCKQCSWQIIRISDEMIRSVAGPCNLQRKSPQTLADYTQTFLMYKKKINLVSQ